MLHSAEFRCIRCCIPLLSVGFDAVFRFILLYSALFCGISVVSAAGFGCIPYYIPLQSGVLRCIPLRCIPLYLLLYSAAVFRCICFIPQRSATPACDLGPQQPL